MSKYQFRAMYYIASGILWAVVLYAPVMKGWWALFPAICFIVSLFRADRYYCKADNDELIIGLLKSDDNPEQPS